MGVLDLIFRTSKRSSLGTLNKRSSRKGYLVCISTLCFVILGSMGGLTIKFKVRTNPRNIRSISDHVLQENMQGQPLHMVLGQNKLIDTKTYDDNAEINSEEAEEEKTTTSEVSDEDSVEHGYEKSNDRKLLESEGSEENGEVLSNEEEENKQFLMLLHQSEAQLRGSQRLSRRDISNSENEEENTSEGDSTDVTSAPNAATTPVPSTVEAQKERKLTGSEGNVMQEKRAAIIATAKTSSNKVIEDDSTKGIEKATPVNSEVQPKSSRGVKTILLYTTLFGSSRWPDLSDQQIVDYPKRARCRYHETCKLTYDKSSVSHADAVVFHGVDLFTKKEYSASRLASLSKTRPSYQRWVFFMHENPLPFQRSKQYDGMFQWTMTYERDSDLFLPYSHYRVLSASEEKSVRLKDYASEKKYMVAFVVKECNPLVINYVRALSKYVDVSVFGACASQIGVPAKQCHKEPGGCSSVLKRYKFIIAFEKAFCKDYITTLFWEPLLRFESVPVVLGANYDNGVVPPNSFIDASRYPSVKSLANYLRYLNEDNAAYNDLFSWKKKYRIEGYDKICKLCEGLHQTNSGAKNHEDIWSRDRYCKGYDSKAEQIRKILEKEK